MNFTDASLVRLASASTRDALLDQLSLEQIATAAHGDTVASLQGPYSAIFDDVEVGVAVPRRAVVQGGWAIAGHPLTEAQFQVFGLNPLEVRVDALWTGAVLARSVPAQTPVVAGSYQSRWPTAEGIDDEIRQALGSLPTDPVALENARRPRYLKRLAAGFSTPADVTDAVLDALLRKLAVASVSELIARFEGDLKLGTLRFQYAPFVAVPSSPQRLPITAAVVIRDVPLSLQDVVADSKSILAHLNDAGFRAPSTSPLVAAPPVVVVWLVPAAMFDDTDWPGATGGDADSQRQQRRTAAAQWLSKERIVFAVPDSA
jgi:hypothetical protein